VVNRNHYVHFLLLVEIIKESIDVINVEETKEKNLVFVELVVIPPQMVRHIARII